MVSQRATALVVFLAVVLVGSLAAVALLRGIRARREAGSDLSAFLTDFSREQTNRSLAGAPAVAFEKQNATTYSNQPLRQGRVFIVTRNYPDPTIVRKLVERRREVAFRLAKRSLRPRSEGAIVVDGRTLFLGNFHISNGRIEADLWQVEGTQPQRVGSIELQPSGDDVIEGSIQLAKDGRRVTYDIFIPRNHPNITKLFQTLKAVHPLNRTAALSAVVASYDNASGTRTG